MGDVQREVATPVALMKVASASDGTAGETQYMFATADGHLWHTLRRADGSWTGLEDVQGKITIPGAVRVVAAAGDGTAGETQYMFATADGHLWHTMRRADGSWQGLGDVQGQFAIPALVRVVAAAGDGTAGETQYFFATADGQDVPAVDQLQIKILSNLQAISNVLAPFQNQGTLLTEINTMLGFVPTLGPAIDQVKAAKARQKQKTLDALTGVINTGQQIVTQTNDAITAITPSIQGEIATEVQSVAAYNLSIIQPDAASNDATYQSFKNFLTVIQGSIPVWGSLLGSSDDKQLQSILAGTNSMILAGTNQLEEFKAHNEAVRSDSS